MTLVSPPVSRSPKPSCLTGHFASSSVSVFFAPLHGFCRYIKHLRFLFRARIRAILPVEGIFPLESVSSLSGRWSRAPAFRLCGPYSSFDCDWKGSVARVTWGFSRSCAGSGLEDADEVSQASSLNIL